MGKTKRKKLSVEEQKILDGCRLRVLTSDKDIKRCDQAIIDHHYLHNANLVGEHMRYALVYRGRWLSVATWGSAALHLKARDKEIGWTPELGRRRIGLLCNNARLLVLPDCHCPNLISRFMKLMLAQLSQDWEQRWGHPIALVETFVDPQLYQGTAYKVSGWKHLGETAGWKRDAQDFYQKHDSPKQIWIRELVKNACVKLRAAELPPAWAVVEKAVAPHCNAKAEEIRNLMEAVRAQVPEFRRAQALAYPMAGLVCLMVMAAAQGVVRGPQDLADYADTLSQAQLRALHFKRDPLTREFRYPKKSTFTRVLQQMDAQVFERVLLSWQDQILGPNQDPIVILDGKKVRHGGVEIVNAVNSQGRFLGSVVTDCKSNEIPAARKLMRELDLVGKISLSDAAHAQVETVQQTVFEQGGDYLVLIKGNQPTIKATLERLFEKQAFSPSTDGADTGAQTGA